jgi:hypothetical protein
MSEERTVGEMIEAGEIGPDSPATRGEVAKLWAYAARAHARLDDLAYSLTAAHERIAALERERDAAVELAHELTERNEAP